MSFSQLGLSESLLATLAEEGYSAPTPIQTQAIPHVLSGKDLLGLAQTGTGKTAAFALPILDGFLRDKGPAARRGPRCLVLTPTRELAIQVAESFKTYGRKTRLGVCVVFGGVGIEPQKAALRRKPEILVATPGRLLDLMGQGEVDLSGVEVFVLDEADRMFDMGFIRDIRKVVAVLPKKRQTLLFSATMPEEIEDLARGILVDPAKVEVTPVSRTAETVEQFLYFCDSKARVPLMCALLEERGVKRSIVFTRMKHVANKIADALKKEGITAEAFHANKSQNARVRALDAFKKGQCRVLVATDIAARGLDVDDVEVVINYDLPEVPETYVHRIGRAGRAGRTGVAWSLVDAEQIELLRDVERVTRCVPSIVAEHPFATDAARAVQVSHEDVRARGYTRTGPRIPSPQARTQRSDRSPTGRSERGRPQRDQQRQGGQGGHRGHGGGQGGNAPRGTSQRPSHGGAHAQANAPRGSNETQGARVNATRGGGRVEPRQGGSRVHHEPRAPSEPAVVRPHATNAPSAGDADAEPRTADSRRGDAPRRDPRPRGQDGGTYLQSRSQSHVGGAAKARVDLGPPATSPESGAPARNDADADGGADRKKRKFWLFGR